ncbi:TetR/AcrR family transcriptional regulator [Streptomonospora sp. PA3]|uniref:TetR/AcrR family transcriptional regulator n=1 Tax=Streptomonospora sp. PA3 TaxID=2607326 RepID=UPI0012DF3B31|nr:TetR/AcrR family transcriptional regulator [Streptomonospora sp. PA3]
MTTQGRGPEPRASGTRERIITAAERLFAERGVVAVSNRQISEAAGQGNNTAVSYHFGSKEELVRAVLRRHAEPIERARRRRLGEAGASADARDWIGCLVHPVTEHLAELGAPSWFARFGAQLMTDPGLRAIMVSEALTTPSLGEVLDGLNRCAPDLPLEVHIERGEMAGQLIIHTCADRERRLARGATTARTDWHGTAVGLVDAITGLWLAPATPADRAERPARAYAAERTGGDDDGGGREWG